MPKRLKKKAIRKALLLVVPTPPATPSRLTKLGRLSTLHKVVSRAALLAVGVGYLAGRRHQRPRAES